MKKVCNMSFEDRQFVLKLLHATKDDFERAFQDLAKSDSIKGKRKFASYWCELAELAFGQPEEEEESCPEEIEACEKATLIAITIKRYRSIFVCKPRDGISMEDAITETLILKKYRDFPVVLVSNQIVLFISKTDTTESLYNRYCEDLKKMKGGEV